MCLENIYVIYMYKKYLALNNIRCLICHKTKPNQIKSNRHEAAGISEWTENLRNGAINLNLDKYRVNWSF